MNTELKSPSGLVSGAQSLASRRPLLTALALSLGAAISLGLSRFSYALLLPPMRDDLGWTYFLSGAINTGNALGYLIGALITPALMRRAGAQTALVGGAVLAGVFMMLSGLTVNTELLILQRVLAGIASAFIFISGGVLAARLSLLHPDRAGLLIGIYYGGTGVGIVVSALLVPFALAAAHAQGAAHAWQWAWVALGAVCLLATLAMALPAKHVDGAPSAPNPHGNFRVKPFVFGLAGYFMFGVGYIGYMTFVIALLKEQGMSGATITWFYSVLGVAVMASSRIWARMLDRFKGGQSMAILNGVLGVATILPALTAAAPLIFASGVLFGAIFLSVVAYHRLGAPQLADPRMVVRHQRFYDRIRARPDRRPFRDRLDRRRARRFAARADLFGAGAVYRGATGIASAGAGVCEFKGQRGAVDVSRPRRS